MRLRVAPRLAFLQWMLTSVVQAWVLRGHYYVFGGEFTSPNQERFHHYKDLWRLDLATNEWEQLHLRGASQARSQAVRFVHCMP